MVLILIQLIHSFLLWILPFYPYPELFIYPYLTSHGFLPYQNILDQHFPGLMFFPINFYTLGFRDPISFKILMILVVIIQSGFIYKITRQFSNKTVAMIVCIVFTIWQPFFDGNQFWINSLLPLLLLPAFWFFLNKKWSWLGFFIGLGIVFKQTVAPLALLLPIFILIQKPSQKIHSIARYVLAGMTPPILMLIYFYRIGVIKDFFYWTIQFNLTTYAKEGSLAPTIGQLLRLTFPIGIVILSSRIKNFRNLSIWSIVWLTLLSIGSLTRFELIHFLPIVPLFSICLGILVYNWILEKRFKRLAVLVILTVVWVSHFYYRQNGYLSIHYFEPETLQLVELIKLKTKPQDKIFLLGVHPHLYALTNTLPPEKVFVFQFPWFLEISGQRVLESLKKDPPRIIVYDSASQIDGMHLRNYADYLVRYVQENFVPSKSIGSITIYESRN